MLALVFIMQSAVTPRAAAGWHVVVLRRRPPRPQRRSERVVVCVGPHSRAQQQAVLHARRRGELGSGCAQGRADFAARHPQLIPIARAAVSVRLVIASVDRPVRRQANAGAVRQRHSMHQERLHSFSHRWHRLPVCGKLLLQVPARWPEPRLDPQPLAFRSLHLRVAWTHHALSPLLYDPTSLHPAFFCPFQPVPPIALPPRPPATLRPASALPHFYAWWAVGRALRTP